MKLHSRPIKITHHGRNSLHMACNQDICISEIQGKWRG